MKVPFETEPDLNLESFFSESGSIARLLPGYEQRPGQKEMALKIEQCFEQGRHTVVEAGTGTGKSLAYIVPAVKYAVKNGVKVVISTYTINLQEQLINQDIPFTARAVDFEFKAGIAKGRNNYICKRRLQFALENKKTLFDAPPGELAELKEWAENTKDGSLSTIPFNPSPSVWDAVKSEHGNCRGRKCPHRKDCFYSNARKELDQCELIVLNHSLLLSDLMLRSRGANILPAYEAAVIDEAHNLQKAAEDHFGINISNNAVDFTLRGLYDSKKRKGLLAKFEDEQLKTKLNNARKACDVFFKQVESYYEHTCRENNGKCGREDLTDNLSGELKELRLSLSNLRAGFSEEEKKSDSAEELRRAVERLSGFESDVSSFVQQPKASEDENRHVYWIEKGGKKQFPRYNLRSAPINAGKDLKECLFDKFESVALTSATLSCSSGKKGFSFFAGNVGLEEYDSLMLGSFFDYKKNVKVVAEADLPEPSSPDFLSSAAQALKGWIADAGGGTLILFTSYYMLKNFAEELEYWAFENGKEIFMQQKGISRTRLVERFKNSDSGILLGTESFWQGVDLPGDALKCVAIMRLPFAVPNHPLTQGKIEQIKANGENPFISFQLPSAIIRFKQGFGRLIRRKTDSGTVVILDSRVMKKFYGRKFLEVLPECSMFAKSQGEFHPLNINKANEH
ncbi:ATP-dependent DNA helicase [Sedimentisphaera salicampi]|uniref:ATP-dependent DNA helicase n=1 Tax=Sedimentisphaera salicampi TaxID=1941349 RepID=UPI000B9A2A69|nr:helicase C-terminal domain-containing protein [Sedimentisphaera salicampi]OXU15383.1 putative ATP-dependent helicase DinG [Sedimentisphaera salicampi]